jgi:6-phosphogluconolactonase
MTEIRNYDLAIEVAEAAATNAVEILNLAIERRGQAVWVLAGGSSPVLAYKHIIKNYADAVEWSLVTILMGDERMVPFEHKDSNWGAIIELFDDNEHTVKVQRIAPLMFDDAEHTAAAYQSAITAAGVKRFDLVWIGVGEDGHTLSLFPGNSALTAYTDQWIIPIHDSPKPPGDRISLSLRACEHIVELVIFAVGASKRDALRQARLKGGLPISIVAETAESYGAEVRYLYDSDAWEQ